VKLVLALALISLATATTAFSDGPRSSRADAEVTATTSSPPGASSRARYRPVRFVAADGVELVGRLSGTGDVGVILAHGFSHGTAQEAWLRFVPALVSRGYTVLTFNFRGFCDSKGCSEGPSQLGLNWRDAMAAVGFMKTRGAKKIFLIGASMGGLAVLRAARMPGVDLSGVVSLSTPQFPSKYYTGEPRANDVTPARLRQIDEPKLFVAGTKDVQLPGTAPLRPGVTSVRFAADARRMFDAAEEPKELALVDSSFHSSELVTSAPADIVKQTRGAVFRFLSENSKTLDRARRKE
jgi:pimeloyl-ACP methyl ester carboxylesterase